MGPSSTTVGQYTVRSDVSHRQQVCGVQPVHVLEGSPRVQSAKFQATIEGRRQKDEQEEDCMGNRWKSYADIESTSERVHARAGNRIAWVVHEILAHSVSAHMIQQEGRSIRDVVLCQKGPRNEDQRLHVFDGLQELFMSLRADTN